MPKSGQAERNMKYGVSFGHDENALKLDSDHHFVKIPKTTELYAL